MLSLLRGLFRNAGQSRSKTLPLVAESGVSDQLLKLDRVAVDLLRQTILSAPRYKDSRRLVGYGFRVYSQFDEDGIIDEIFQRIDTTNRWFVEFGVGSGLENNTLYRLARAWAGLWIEGNARSTALISETFQELFAGGRLTLIKSFVTAENIERLFASAQVPEEFDLLSIDIDGNDYWIWQAITSYHPRVVIVEYNAGIGPTAPWAMPYRADFVYDGSRAFGASLKALELLGRAKGYALVACSASGVNAFFVRSDLVRDQFFSPFDAETHFEPPRYYLQPFPGHAPSQKELAAIVAGPPVLPATTSMNQLHQ